MPVIEIPQTFLGMGRRSFRRTLPVVSLVPNPEHWGDDFGMMAIWERANAPWLKVVVESGGRAWEDAGPDGQAFSRVRNQTAVDGSGLSFDAQRYQAVVAMVKRVADVVLRVEIHTEHRKLAEAVRARRTPERPGGDLHVTITFASFDGRNGRAGAFTHKVQLHVAPLTELPVFAGFAALDLGNFSSSVACLRNGKQSRRDVQLVSCRGEEPKLESAAESLASLVRIDGVTTWYADESASRTAPSRVVPDARFPQDDKSATIRWVVGKVARDGPLPRQVSGAKRMLVRPDAEAPFPVPLKHTRVFVKEHDSEVVDEVVGFRHRLPAELLAASMIQQFLQATEPGHDTPAGWPRYLAVTYPTSYAPAEIFALRSAVHRAWLRALNENQAPPAAAEADGGEDPAAPDGRDRRRIAAALQRRLDPNRKSSLGEAFLEEDELIPLMIDEATAASFHFLFRFSAEAVGGLIGFRLKYPDGMNLLLYDCGGGTTDIALVQAKVEAGGSRLTLAVLGRSGVRHFGGDDITAAVCKLLKAKITAAALREKEQRTIPPIALSDRVAEPGSSAVLLENAREVARFLKAVNQADPQSRYVPTRFNPSDVSPETYAPREHALTLWSWGEQLKQKFGVTVPGRSGQESQPIRAVGLGLTHGEDGFARETGPLYRAILEAVNGRNLAGDKAFAAALLKIQVTRAEIDAMVARKVVRTLACCRSLIQAKLPGERDKVAPVVHRVAVSGGASRYPLICEMLLERLQVSDLEEKHWFHYDEADLKNVVAKGAVQALAAMNAGVERFRFDSRMADSLPFDVGYKSWRTNDILPVYRLQQKYSALKPVVVEMPAAGDDPADRLLRQFSLFRRFAGDGDTLDTDDRGLPNFDDGEDLDRLEEQKGYELYLIWEFDEPIVGNVTVSYDHDAHTFGVRDGGNAEGKLRKSEAESLRARAPHERGTL